MKIIKVLLFLLVAFAGYSCKKDFLQRDVGTQTTLENVFQDPLQASRYADNTYTYSINDYGRLDGYKGMTAQFSDEAISNGAQPQIAAMNKGLYLDPSASDVVSIYTQMYRGIRNANTTLAYIGSTPWTADYRPDLIKGEQLYLRAYFYFELLKRYGGVVLLTEAQEFTQAAEDLPRSSFEEVLTRILADLKEAKDLLPLTNEDWPNPAAQANRATGAAALTLRARALLLAASPLHNPNNNLDKWKLAAEAAKDIINLNKFSLHPDYASLLTVPTSSEYIRIWPRGGRSFIGTYISDYLVPTSFGGAQSNLSVTQNHVDLYEMKNGKPISDPTSGYNPQSPYANRDPRLKVNVLYNGDTWQGRTVETWQSEPNAQGTVTYGRDINTTLTFTKTGYYLKRLWPETSRSGSTASALLNYVFYRYAEVLLNYAEALNEAEGPQGNDVKEKVDMVRVRAGLPPLPDNLTQSEMRDRIRNERAVEFAFEDMRWWDILRWKKGAEIVAQPTRGMKIEKKANGTFSYSVIELPNFKKVFEDRMHIYPVPQAEINKTSGNLIQTEGW